MKFLFILAVLGLSLVTGVYQVLQNGSFLRYLDTHPNPKTVPRLEYVIGQGYYIWGDLQNSATYYVRIVERYPNSPLADDAYFYYLQALDDNFTSRSIMAELYQTYLDRYPHGLHVEIAQKRLEYCRNFH